MLRSLVGSEMCIRDRVSGYQRCQYLTPPPRADADTRCSNVRVQKSGERAQSACSQHSADGSWLAALPSLDTWSVGASCAWIRGRRLIQVRTVLMRPTLFFTSISLIPSLCCANKLQLMSELANTQANTVTEHQPPSGAVIVMREKHCSQAEAPPVCRR